VSTSIRGVFMVQTNLQMNVVEVRMTTDDARRLSLVGVLSKTEARNIAGVLLAFADGLTDTTTTAAAS
jgi:hypothetical protein